jgi:hypothetical protein
MRPRFQQKGNSTKGLSFSSCHWTIWFGQTFPILSRRISQCNTDFSVLTSSFLNDLTLNQPFCDLRFFHQFKFFRNNLESPTMSNWRIYIQTCAHSFLSYLFKPFLYIYIFFFTLNLFY